MTVEQYSTRFMELARFAANLIPDEESKVERFENCLSPRIKERVICHKINDYARLVEVASLADKGIYKSAVAYDLKRQLKQHTSYPEKRLAIEYDFNPTVSKSFPLAPGNQKTPYNKRGKLHMGDCRIGSPNCFKCGKSGWRIKTARKQISTTIPCPSTSIFTYPRWC